MLSHSPTLDEAIEIIDGVKRRPQSMAERKRLAVDLAALMLNEAAKGLTPVEKKAQEQLFRLMQDPVGKAFTTSMTDECFRSTKNRRIADQMIHLLNQFGIPSYLNRLQKLQLLIFKSLPSSIAQFLVPFAAYELRKQTARVILPGEAAALEKHILERKAQGVRLNLNHLGKRF